MDRTIILDGRGVRLRASAAIPRLYRLKFRRDIIHDMVVIQKAIQAALPADVPDSDTSGEEITVPLPLEALTLFENVAYLMARHADSSVPDSVDEWLDGFETFSIYQIFPVIQELWEQNLRTLAAPKK